uniref:Uncharacterized protein n=1 Tax=Arion vulgaris TaxID=1028688 RepID=A0A0B7B8N6_9EUPU
MYIIKSVIIHITYWLYSLKHIPIQFMSMSEGENNLETSASNRVWHGVTQCWIIED